MDKLNICGKVKNLSANKEPEYGYASPMGGLLSA